MRRYKSENSNKVKYFIGHEKLGLHTYNKKFIGVVGLQPYDEIVTKAIENGCEYVLLGANKSFIPASNDDENWYSLIEQILISTQLKVILSVNMTDTGLFDFDRLKTHNRFHLQLYILSINIDDFPSNTTVIFEDRLWEQNNRMLYSLQMSDIVKSENGVAWDDIATDTIIDKTE